MMHLFARVLVPSLLLVGIASATDRWFSDLSALSANGRFHAEAKSPDNRSSNPKPFQENFKVTLLDKESGMKLWEHDFKHQTTPTKLIPTDDGRLVQLGCLSDYCVFDKAGTPKEVFRLLESLTKTEKEKFTDWTTAGIFWNQFSQDGLLLRGEKLYYYIRLYWGRKFVIDLDTASLSDDKAIHRFVEKHLTEKAKQLLAEFNGTYTEKCDSCEGDHLRADLKNAAFLLKTHPSKGSEKFLRELLKQNDDGAWPEFEEYLKRL